MPTGEAPGPPHPQEYFLHSSPFPSQSSTLVPDIVWNGAEHGNHSFAFEIIGASHDELELIEKCSRHGTAQASTTFASTSSRYRMTPSASRLAAQADHPGWLRRRGARPWRRVGLLRWSVSGDLPSMACSLFDDLRRRRNHDLWLTLIQLNLAGNRDWAIGQRPQEFSPPTLATFSAGTKPVKTCFG